MDENPPQKLIQWMGRHTFDGDSMQEGEMQMSCQYNDRKMLQSIVLNYGIGVCAMSKDKARTANVAKFDRDEKRIATQDFFISSVAILRFCKESRRFWQMLPAT